LPKLTDFAGDSGLLWSWRHLANTSEKANFSYTSELGSEKTSLGLCYRETVDHLCRPLVVFLMMTCYYWWL